MISALLILKIYLFSISVNGLWSGSRITPVNVRKSALEMTPLESASTLLPAILRRVEPSEAKGAFAFFFLQAVEHWALAELKYLSLSRPTLSLGILQEARRQEER